MHAYRAYLIAQAAHAQQHDAAGNPYFAHVEDVYRRVNVAGYDDDVQQAAVLHDILEDTPYTEDLLRRIGVSDTVVDAVVSVTRQEGERYFDFIARASQNPIGIVVKFADLLSNMSEERMSVLAASDPDKARSLSARYRKAKEILLSADQSQGRLIRIIAST